MIKIEHTLSIYREDNLKEWSKGEIQLAQTYNYRSFLPERRGLFCCIVFGPIVDYECLCRSYSGIKHADHTCERCGVEILPKEVREHRLGHIQMARTIGGIGIIPVFPPVGRTEELNDLYRRLIDSNNRMKRLLDNRAPDILLLHETFILRSAMEKVLEYKIENEA